MSKTERVVLSGIRPSKIMGHDIEEVVFWAWCGYGYKGVAVAKVRKGRRERRGCMVSVGDCVVWVDVPWGYVF